MDEQSSNCNEDGPHDKCAEDPPKEHGVLIGGRNVEVGEDQQKDKDIIDAQGFFDQIVRQKL